MDSKLKECDLEYIFPTENVFQGWELFYANWTEEKNYKKTF